MPIVSNQHGGYAVIRTNDSETTSFSDLALPGETVTAATIAEVMCTNSRGTEYNIARTTGSTSNTVFTAGVAGHWDFQSSGIRLERAGSFEEQGDVVITRQSQNPSMIVVKMHKSSAAS